MNKILGIIAPVLILFVSSCCGRVTCDCFDDFDASIGFPFNMDSSSASGFKNSEIEHALFIRYNQSGEVIDTSRLAYYSGYLESYFNIPNYSATSVKSFKDTCSYRILNKVGNVDLTINDIQISGRFEDGCCSCYSNESIAFRVNGELVKGGGNGRQGATYLINKNQ